MNRFVAPLLLACTLAATSVRAETADDQYVRIYNVIQSGDALSQSPDQVLGALNRYMEAQAQLQKFQKANPEWNPKVVNYRLNYLSSKVALLSSKFPGGTAPAPAPTPVVRPTTPVPVTPSTPAPTTVVAPKPNAEMEAKYAALQADVRRLQGDKNLLEAKLKEALAAQPAASDPRELQKANDRIQGLLKENELLKAGVSDKKPSEADAKVLEDTKQQLAAANKKLTEQTERSNTLATEKKALQTKLDEMAAKPDNTGALADARKSLDEANRKLAEQANVTKQLASEKDSLNARVRSLTMSADAAEALRAENEILKKQLAQSKTASSEVAKNNDAAVKLTQAEARIAALQSDAEILRLEKTALENRVKTMANAPAKPGTVPAVTSTVLPTSNTRTQDLARIKQLETERDELTKKLETANKEIYGRKGKTASDRVDELTVQINNLRARLEVFEARAVPYNEEELALFKKSETKLAVVDPNANKKSMKELPSGVEALVASAQRHFASKQYDQAEADYLAILRRDEKNSYTLANLAAIQLERGRLDEAEKNIKLALAGNPEDGYSLSILGYIKFRQQKFDDALDALSKAARMDPSSAEVQNYLGVTLSHKGLRGPAETALRKAIQINPGYGSAHNNLAVIYATQNPPLLELARWHYDRALAAGHPKNPELEKMFGQKSATAAAK